VVVPSADQSEHDFMARFANRSLMEALFDDGWSGSTSRFPDGHVEVVGQWNTRTTLPVAAPDGRLHRRVETVGPGPNLSTSVVTGLGLLPDDIFVQCGIQFRLQQFVTIEETDHVFVNRRDATNQPICGGLTKSIKLHSHFQDAYKPLLDHPELVTVVFTNLFDHPTCLSRTLGEYASSTNDVLISTQDIASGAGSATPRTLSHELGHSLGLVHTTCTGDVMDDLMCAGGSTSSHIVGCDTRDGVALSPLPFNCVSRGETPGPTSEVSCDRARRGARKFIADVTPPTVDAGADQVLECSSPMGADVTLTATASDPETGILSTHWSSPSKPNLGSTSTVTTTQAIGKTTYTVSVNNPGLMTATDTVDVTVRDTTPPTVTGASLTTQNGCATGGVITLPVPTVTDACSGSPTLSGTLIQTDGVTLPTPTPIVGGTAALPPGTHVVSWVASDGTNSSAPFLQTVNVLACFASGQSMNIGDRAQMKTKEGGWAPITNHGTGVLEVSASAHVGTITSVGAVALRSAVKVTGSVTSAGRVDKDPTTEVSGAIKQFATVSLPPLPTLSNPWPPSSAQQVVLEPDKTGSITPGTYKLVSVKSRATLQMAPGTYYIEDLQVLEPQSIVKLSGATTIEVKTRVVNRGAFRNGSGAAAPVAIRYRGSEQVFLDTAF
jgi:hypothetical protein